MERYFCLYDLQLDGFKAGYCSSTREEMEDSARYRIISLSENDEEPADDNDSTEDLMEQYGYEVREVSQEVAEYIENSDEHGLTTTVSLPEHLEKLLEEFKPNDI